MKLAMLLDIGSGLQTMEDALELGHCMRQRDQRMNAFLGTQESSLCESRGSTMPTGLTGWVSGWMNFPRVKSKSKDKGLIPGSVLRCRFRDSKYGVGSVILNTM